MYRRPEVEPVPKSPVELTIELQETRRELAGYVRATRRTRKKAIRAIVKLLLAMDVQP